MTIDKVEKFAARQILLETLATVRELENDLAMYLDDVGDTHAIHDEAPLLFVILEDCEHLGRRLERAIAQVDDIKESA